MDDLNDDTSRAEASPANDDIVTTLEGLLVEARAGRILFFLASVGHVAAPDPAADEQRRSFAFGNAAIDNPNVTREMVERAEKAVPRPTPFRVSVSAFLGEKTAVLHSASLESAHKDVQTGIQHATRKMAEAVGEEVASRRVAERRRRS